MSILSFAQIWNALGIATIPIRYKDKRPALASWERYQHHLPSDTELAKWFCRPFVNLAVVVGWRNLVVVDFDSDTEYERWLLWLSRRPAYRWVRSTYQVKTARGVHVYVTTVQPAFNAKLPGIDIKAQSGYVLAPPSVHPSGPVYTQFGGDLPVRIEALSEILPAELLAAHTQRPKTVTPAPVPVVISDDPWSHAEYTLDPDRDLIEQIKERYRIEQFFPRLRSRDGRWHMTNCPFHDDKSPSMWVDTERQRCGCFAGCTAQSYDVIDLYARLHNVSIVDAIRLMAAS